MPKRSTIDPGLYVGFNADDDDRDRVRDLDQTGPIPDVDRVGAAFDEQIPVQDLTPEQRRARTAEVAAGNRFQEDDLQKAVLFIGGGDLDAEDEVVLEVRPRRADSRGRIKIYSSRNKAQLLLDASQGSGCQAFFRDDAPREIWIEGVELSREPKDIILRVSVPGLLPPEEGKCLDTIDITVVGPTVQRSHGPSAEERTHVACITDATVPELQASQVPAKLHAYVYSTEFSTGKGLLLDSGTESDIDVDIFSYDRLSQAANRFGYWRQVDNPVSQVEKKYLGTVEEFDPGRHTSQDEVQPVRINDASVDQEFLTLQTSGFYVVGQNALWFQDFGNAEVNTVVGEPGGRVIVRLFEDLEPQAGIRPPGWMVRIVRLEVVAETGIVVGGTRTFSAGQRVRLTARIDPPGESLSAFDWQIPDSPIRNYSGGVVTPLTAADLSQAGVDFYWADGRLGRNIRVRATVGSSPCEGRLVADVEQPTFRSFTSFTGTVSVDPVADELQFGADVPGDRGILWTAEIGAPAHFAGDVRFTQLITPNRAFRDATGWGHYRPGEGLDEVENYSDPAPPAPIAAGATGSFSEHDSPVSHAQAGDLELQIGTVARPPAGSDESYRAFVMFRPAGADSIFVSVGILEWGWHGSVSRAAPGAAWGTPTGGPTAANPAGVETRALPTWGQVHNLRLGFPLTPGQ